MSARDNILGRLRAAPPGAPAPLPDLDAWYGRLPACDGEARIERFRAAMLAAHAEVHDTDAGGWSALLLEIAAPRDAFAGYSSLSWGDMRADLLPTLPSNVQKAAETFAGELAIDKAVQTPAQALQKLVRVAQVGQALEPLLALLQSLQQHPQLPPSRPRSLA